MSNPYIPDQLHHMSKKELLEFAQVAHEENVKLAKDLAKANERVEELKKNKHKETLETISDYILEFMHANNIENFSTNRLSTNEGRQVELTIRYVDGETPADQLAKANERVKELESQYQLLTKRIEPLLDMQEDGEHYARCHLADDIYEYFIEGSSVDALNKFAIEQKIEAIKEAIRFSEPRSKGWFKKQFDGNAPIEYRDGIDCMTAFLDDYAKKLRQEQSK
jgi:vacuolar-type H+-ATPase subunit I/STV1